MADTEDVLRPSDVIGDRIRELRRIRGWTAKQLASRCAEAGAADLTAPAILNIETGRRGPDGRRTRNVTVEELLILASVLSEAPISLMFPLEALESGTPPATIEVTPKRRTSDRVLLRRWVAAIDPIGPVEELWMHHDELDLDKFYRFDEEEDIEAEALRDATRSLEKAKRDLAIATEAATKRVTQEASRAAIGTLADMLVDLASLQVERGADSDEGFAAGAQALLAIYGVNVIEKPHPERDFDELAFFARLAARVSQEPPYADVLERGEDLVEVVTKMPRHLSRNVVENWARGHAGDPGIQDVFANLSISFAPDLIAASAADHPDLARALYGASDAWRTLHQSRTQRQRGESGPRKTKGLRRGKAG